MDASLQTGTMCPCRPPERCFLADRKTTSPSAPRPPLPNAPPHNAGWTPRGSPVSKLSFAISNKWTVSALVGGRGAPSPKEEMLAVQGRTKLNLPSAGHRPRAAPAPCWVDTTRYARVKILFHDLEQLVAFSIVTGKGVRPIRKKVS